MHELNNSICNIWYKLPVGFLQEIEIEFEKIFQ